MASKLRVNDSVRFYLEEMGSRIVAKSGIPSDRYHLGKLVLQGLKDDPDLVLQIDGATGESETSASVLKRSVQCAVAFQNLGLKHGDVMVLMAPNHLDLAIPFYAGLYLGVIVAPIDRTLGVREIQDVLMGIEPKIVFCQNETLANVQKGIDNLHLDCKVITFDKGEHGTFTELLENQNYSNVNTDNFKPADFDTAESIAMLTSTSGTTGLPKAAALTHKNMLIGNSTLWARNFKFPTPTRLNLIVSPLQWLSAGCTFLLSPIVRYTRLQTSLPTTPKHVYDLINTYKPTHMLISPPFITTLLKPGEHEQCDFSCFEIIGVGGSVVHKELMQHIKTLIPNADVTFGYGMSEVAGGAFAVNNPPLGSLGTRLGIFEYRLVDISTQEDIEEPNKPGELWMKGPSIFKGYYNNPEATKEIFTEDGWLKTGDILYRDEYWHYYYVDRIKQLLKYRNHQISPLELETVISEHPGVLEVVVLGIPDREYGDLAVACIVKRPGSHVTAQEIKDLIKDTLSESKQLRGGVIFMDELPVTATNKVDRMKLKTLVTTLERE